MPRRPPLHEQLGVSKKELRQYKNAMWKRVCWRLLLTWGMGAYMLTGVALGAAFILPEYREQIPIWLMNWTVMFLSAMAMGTAAQLRFRRLFREHLTEPRCIHCGYDLKGLANTPPNHITCPECGKPSPHLQPTDRPA
ncbi:MAG: hypothetical protein KDA20_07810 [Phycisphaerales bacterium]|nr:hypothetical protein [Phycisphaerales bacterium]